MALNWVLIENNIQALPIPINGEVYHNEEFKEIHLECISGSGYPGSGGSYMGRGRLHLSNLRILFVSDPPHIWTFSMPYAIILNEELKSPFFGSPYFTCALNPLMNGSLRSVGNLTITFLSKEDSSHFMVLLNEYLHESRAALNSSSANRELQLSACQLPNYIQSPTHMQNVPLQPQNLSSNSDTAFIDPNDPSVVLIKH